MSANPASSDNTPLATVRQRLPRIVLASSVVAALAHVASSGLAPRYVAEAQLQFAAKGNLDKEALNGHVRALTAPDVAVDIAGRMNLKDKVEFNSALGSVDAVGKVLRLAGVGAPRPGENEHDRVMGAFSRQLDVSAAKDSRGVGVRFTSTDPELAAQIANALTETYRAKLAATHAAEPAAATPATTTTTAPAHETNEARKAQEMLVAQLVADVAAADAEVERARAQDNIARGAQTAGLAEQLGEQTAELARLKAARAEADTKVRAARDLIKSGNGDVLPDLQKQPMMQSILQQRIRLERQISELSATLLPEHPRMRQLNADLAGMKKQIGAEVARLVDGLDKEAKAAAVREDVVKKSVEEIKSRVASSSVDDGKLRQLEGVAKATRAELERQQALLAAIHVQPDTAAASVPAASVGGDNAPIVTQARVPTVAAFPKKLNIAALAFVSTFLLGFALSLVRAAMSGARPAVAPKVAAGAKGRAAPDSAAAARAAPAGAQPAPKASAYAAHELARAEADGLMSVEEIAETIAILPQQPTGFRTLVVGAADGVAAGLEAVEIAHALAAKGQAVVVVEWSPDGDSMAYDLERNSTPGMNELITGAATFEQVVTSIPGSDAHFIAAGGAIAARGATIDPDLVNLLLDALDEAYEHIVVVGRYEAARGLFESILGRFDAGVLVTDGVARRRPPPGTFLGFEVTDISIMHHDRGMVAAAAPAPVQVRPQAQPAPAPARTAAAAPVSAPAPATAAKSKFALPGLSKLGIGGKGKSAETAVKAEAPAKPAKRRRKGEADAETPAYPAIPQDQLVARALRRNPPPGRSVRA